MDGASFWSALTKPSVFSYAAKAFILISLFPSGLNLEWDWGLLSVEVLKCMCAMLLSIQGQNSLVLMFAEIAKVPAKCFSPRAVLSVFLAPWRRFLCVLLRCTGMLLFQCWKSREQAFIPVEPGQKEVASQHSRRGQRRKSPAEQNKTWQLLLAVESQRKFTFNSICNKPIARVKSSTHLQFVFFSLLTTLQFTEAMIEITKSPIRDSTNVAGPERNI